ncbi:MAG: NADP-dependent oxidoreductase [Chromatiales bacterium]|jgi:NADPH-dependent curcumin reductase CurA|nr:NADP-dependent oxidoreductase [Chromatiales bacterium]MDP6151051.1 NADP-dependent oxidoreductase [Gammaproteobacteria bacterium]MDP7093932.1 NADP-dependent oxidoreductase [Gammaproteobacteria bacterium]MDP7271423.1 NADP-dependent oxidoreductase [Gammaproteobacteria bacterium]HJP05346.1 NADP-dependent oxidoreductase [Gammaproteobacteria bacterium]
MSDKNRKIVLASPISGIPRADNFRTVETDIPVPGEGQILVRHVYLSLDPYQRPAIAGAHVTSNKALEEEEVPSAETIGQVVSSNNPDFVVGDYVRHMGGWQEYSVADSNQVFRVDPDQAPLSTYLGILGMPGLTAYASMIKLADVQAGQSVLVSSASGPVGSMVGQIAVRKGATAYGVAGSDEKCSFVVDDLGFADCINYKAADYPGSLAERIPNGVDIYHDAVGGQMLIDALGVLKNYGTVVMCGLISQYNESEKGRGFNLAPAIIKRAVMKGLIVFDFEDKRQEFFDLAAPWVREGKIKYREDRAIGIENTGAHFERLMSGQNFGKALVVLGDH